MYCLTDNKITILKNKVALKQMQALEPRSGGLPLQIKKTREWNQEVINTSSERKPSLDFLRDLFYESMFPKVLYSLLVTASRKLELEELTEESTCIRFRIKHGEFNVGAK